jgi:hypothetical protein
VLWGWAVLRYRSLGTAALSIRPGQLRTLIEPAR